MYSQSTAAVKVYHWAEDTFDVTKRNVFIKHLQWKSRIILCQIKIRMNFIFLFFIIKQTLLISKKQLIDKNSRIKRVNLLYLIIK